MFRRPPPPPTAQVVEEYTLLLALNTDAQAAKARGGHTRVHFLAGGKQRAAEGAAAAGVEGPALSVAYDTTSPGKTLLFRKVNLVRCAAALSVDPGAHHDLGPQPWTTPAPLAPRRLPLVEAEQEALSLCA